MSVAKSCPNRETMLLVLHGSGPPDVIERLAVHLETCAPCGSTFDTLVQQDATAIALRSRPAADGVSAGAIKKLQSRLAKIRPPAVRDKTALTINPNHVSGSSSLPAGIPMDTSASDITFLAPALLPDEIGRLGHYRILKKLGAGGMGMVFLAEDTHLRRKVALKTMLPNIAVSPQARERFLREAQAAAALEHVNVVAIYQVGEDNGVPYLAMPFLKGESLEDRLLRLKKLTPFEAARIAVEMAEGLTAAHAEGLIHRDIKPGNVWLEGERGQVKLLDFGLARAQGDTTHLTHSGAIVGTPAFMAPEQARSEAVDGRADLFSLGCTLYVMLTGQRPFTGDTTIALLTALALDMPKAPHLINPELPDALSDLTMRLLAKKPAERPASAKEVAAELRRIVRAEVQAAQAKNAVSPIAELANRPRKQPGGAAPSRRRWLIAASVLGAAALLAGIIVIIKDKKGNEVARVIVPDDGKVEIVDDAKNKAKPEPPKVMPPTPSPEEVWLKQIAAMSAAQQVKAVSEKLKKLNPGFDGTVTPISENGVVTELSFVSDKVTDLSPVRALTGLRTLRCRCGTWYGANKALLADLSPLKDMKLTYLECGDTRVSDLTPLKGMKLTYLNCGYTGVFDLTPLKGMPLTALRCDGSQVTDWTPIKDLKLTFLDCGMTNVSDLTPFKDMPLITLMLFRCSGVSDLTPIKDLKLKQLAIAYTSVSDLSPLKDMPLTSLDCQGSSKLSDAGLVNLKNLTNLNGLSLSGTMVSDVGLEHLKGLTKLTNLGL